MRLLAVAVVSAAALVVTSAGATAPTLAESRVCTPENVAVHISLLGDRTWGWQIGGFRSIPPKVTTIAVWSMGGPIETQGVAVYGWTVRNRSGFFSECSRGQARRRVDGGLSAAHRVKDGWFAGRKFTCLDTGRIVVAISDTRSGKRVTVRALGTGKLIALGEVTRGGGWLRGSKSCRVSEK